MNSGATFYLFKDAIRVTLPNNSGTISFDKKIKTKNGYVLAGILKPAEQKQIYDIAIPAQLKENNKNSYRYVHDVLCHTNDQNTRATAKKLKIEIPNLYRMAYCFGTKTIVWNQYYLVYTLRR